MATKLLCTFPGCGRRHVARGYCHTHYEMQRRGDPLRPLKQQTAQPPECLFDGCGLKPQACGLCHGHYRQKSLGKELKPLRFVRTWKYDPDLLCEFDGCGRAPKSRGLCAAHYRQSRTTGALKPIGVCACGKPTPTTKRAYCSEECVYWGVVACKYKILASEMFAHVNRQQGACAICERTDRRLVVDHCHGTGAVRGLLCSGCNTGIGLLGDDIGMLSKAVTYLQG